MILAGRQVYRLFVEQLYENRSITAYERARLLFNAGFRFKGR